MSDVYRRDFFSLVTKLADEFTQDQCEKLSYVYQDKFTASFLDQNSKNPLKLLDYLVKEGTFGLEKPENLASVMQDLGYSDKKRLVDSFIDCHKIPANSLRGRALPPTPEPVQEEAEGPYVVFQQVPDISPVNRPVPVEDQALRDELSVKPTLLEKGTDSSNSSDEEDIYEEISVANLKHISHEIPPLLIEVWRFLVNQLRYLATRNTEGTLRSDVFHCPVLNFSFMLEVNPSDNQNVSAKLFLTIDKQKDSTHFIDTYFQVDLKVSQSRSPRALRQFDSHKLHLSYVSKVMEHPALSHASSDERTLSEVLPTGNQSDNVCVATFPSIISHRVLLDKTLVTTPYLIFTVTLRHRQ